MSRHVIHHDGWFFEWSTTVDAPFGYGSRREDFVREHVAKHGESSRAKVERDLDRAMATGTSAEGAEQSAERMVGRANSAGYDETHLPLAEIVRIYCVERRDPRKGEGEVATRAA